MASPDFLLEDAPNDGKLDLVLTDMLDLISPGKRSLSMDGSSPADGLLQDPGLPGSSSDAATGISGLSPHGPSPLSQPLPGQQIPAHSLAAAPAAAGVPVIIQQQQQQQQAAATTTAAPAAAYAVSTGTTRPADAPGIETMHAPGAFSGFDASRFPTAQQQPAVQPQPHGQQQLPPGYVPLPGQPPHAAAVPNMAYPQPALAYAPPQQAHVGYTNSAQQGYSQPCAHHHAQYTAQQAHHQQAAAQAHQQQQHAYTAAQQQQLAMMHAAQAQQHPSVQAGTHVPLPPGFVMAPSVQQPIPGVPAKLLPKVQKSGGAMRSNSQPKDDGFGNCRPCARTRPARPQPPFFFVPLRAADQSTTHAACNMKKRR